jgi:hypothetical protein
MEQNILTASAFDKAVMQGFIHDFSMLSSGDLICHSNGKCYQLKDIILDPITCSVYRMTVYCITTRDGLKGTLIGCWEDYALY